MPNECDEVDKRIKEITEEREKKCSIYSYYEPQTYTRCKAPFDRVIGNALAEKEKLTVLGHCRK